MFWPTVIGPFRCKHTCLVEKTCNNKHQSFAQLDYSKYPYPGSPVPRAKAVYASCTSSTYLHSIFIFDVQYAFVNVQVSTYLGKDPVNHIYNLVLYRIAYCFDLALTRPNWAPETLNSPIEKFLLLEVWLIPWNILPRLTALKVRVDLCANCMKQIRSRQLGNGAL